MPGQGKYTKYTRTQTEVAAKGQSSTSLMAKLFGTPYGVPDDKAQATIIATANQFLLASDDNVQDGDPGFFNSGVNMNYQGGPNYVTEKDAIVKTGDQGNPSSPFTPNLTSPGEANGVNPVGQSNMGVNNDAGYAILNPHAQVGAGGLKSPQTEAANMGAKVLGDPLILGKNPGTSTGA